MKEKMEIEEVDYGKNENVFEAQTMLQNMKCYACGATTSRYAAFSTKKLFHFSDNKIIWEMDSSTKHRTAVGRQFAKGKMRFFRKSA
jgi:hypothetical protein